jgi:CBS domain containing-hemolysin-like protein
MIDWLERYLMSMEGWAKAILLIFATGAFAAAEFAVFTFFRDSMLSLLGPGGQNSVFYTQYLQNTRVGLTVTNLLFAATLVFFARENFPEVRTILKSALIFAAVFASVTSPVLLS